MFFLCRDQLPASDSSKEEDVGEAAEPEVPLPNIMHFAVQAKLRSRELFPNRMVAVWQIYCVIYQG